MLHAAQQLLFSQNFIILDLKKSELLTKIADPSFAVAYWESNSNEHTIRFWTDIKAHTLNYSHYNSSLLIAFNAIERLLLWCCFWDSDQPENIINLMESKLREFFVAAAFGIFFSFFLLCTQIWIYDGEGLRIQEE